MPGPGLGSVGRPPEAELGPDQRRGPGVYTEVRLRDESWARGLSEWPPKPHVHTNSPESPQPVVVSKTLSMQLLGSRAGGALPRVWGPRVLQSGRWARLQAASFRDPSFEVDLPSKPRGKRTPPHGPEAWPVWGRQPHSARSGRATGGPRFRSCSLCSDLFC